MINPFRKVNCFKENTTFSVYAYNITASVLIKCTLYSKDGDFNFFFFQNRPFTISIFKERLKVTLNTDIKQYSEHCCLV